MNSFKLSILSMDKPFYVGDCVSLVVPVSDGMLGIQANHPPMTAAVRAGIVSFTLPDGTRRECVVSRGIVDISKNDPRILCETVMDPDEVDEEMARRALEEAQIALDEEKGRKDYIISQQAFANAFNSLKVKQHRAMKTNN